MPQQLPAENVKFDDENIAQYLWVVEKAVGTDGKTYYTFKNPGKPGLI